MVNRTVKTVSDLIAALEAFKRHYGDKAPVAYFSSDSGDGSCEDSLAPVTYTAEVGTELEEFWPLVTEPTLLLG